MTKIDLFSLSIFILFLLFCIPGICVFYNSWRKRFFSIRDQIMRHLREDFLMRAGDYEQIINYDLSNTR